MISSFLRLPFLRQRPRLSQLLSFLSFPQNTFITLTSSSMAPKQTLQSKYKLLSGHEIPVLGYGVSIRLLHLDVSNG